MRVHATRACSLWIAFALAMPGFAGTAPRRIVSTAPSLTETLYALVARTVFAPVELPVGVITALLGGPFFLWLLLSRRREVFF